MKKFILYISLFIALPALSQPTEWLQTPGGGAVDTVKCTNTTTYKVNGVQLTPEYYLGVVDMVSGTVHGYANYSTNDFSIVVSVDQSDSLIGKELVIKLWDGANGCFIDDVFISGTTGGIMYFTIDTAGVTIDTLSANTLEFGYTSSTLCIDGSVVTPTTISDSATLSVTTGMGYLDLNEQTGAITTASSDPGNYTIILSPAYSCYDNYTVTIIIEDCDTTHNSTPDDVIISPYSGDPDYEQTQFTCAGGTIIYDANGNAVKTLDYSQSWNGTDDSGNILPSGEYYAKCNDEVIIINILY